MIKRFVATFILLIGFGVLMAQGDAKNLVQWKTEYDIQKWEKGKTVTVTFTGIIKPGYHVYSANQPSKAVLPLKITLDKATKGVQLLSLTEEGNRAVVFDDVFQVEIASFDGEMIIKQEMKVKKKKFPIKGNISYQVCNEEMCLTGAYSFEIK